MPGEDLATIVRSIVASPSDIATPHDSRRLGHHSRMPDPFLFIVAIIALACVLLFPIRLWRRRRHRYDIDDEEP